MFFWTPVAEARRGQEGQSRRQKAHRRFDCLYDAVATQDTVTLVRSAIVGVLRIVDEATAKELASAIISSGTRPCEPTP